MFTGSSIAFVPPTHGLASGDDALPLLARLLDLTSSLLLRHHPSSSPSSLPSSSQ
jgi:hypothetical protein